MHSSHFTVLILSLGLLAPVAAQPDTDKEGTDVRLFAAFPTERVIKVSSQPGPDTTDIQDPNDCLEVARHAERRFNPTTNQLETLFEYVDFDCTKGVERLLGVQVINPARIYRVACQTGTRTPVSPAMGASPNPIIKSGTVIDVYTVSPDEAFKRSTGIQFFLSSGSRSLAKPTSSFASGTLRHSMAPARVHRFAVVHWGQAFDSFALKPRMEFDGGATYRVWEDLSPHHGKEYWEGSPVGGSGNYRLRLGRTDRVDHTDLLNQNVLTVPAAPVTPGTIEFVAHKDLEVLSATLGHGEATVYDYAMAPYTSSRQLHLTEDNAFLVAGTRLWVRFPAQAADGGRVKMFHSVDGGSEQTTQGLLGGSCLGPFAGCFQLTAPASARRELSYRFEISYTDGRPTRSYDNFGSGFRVPIVAPSDRELRLEVAGAHATSALEADSTFALRYDPQRMLNAMAAQGIVPGVLRMAVRVSFDNNPATLYPLGHLSPFTDSSSQLKYRGELARLPLAIPSGATTMSLVVEGQSRLHGQLESTTEDQQFEVVLGGAAVGGLTSQVPGQPH